MTVKNVERMKKKIAGMPRDQLENLAMISAFIQAGYATLNNSMICYMVREATIAAFGEEALTKQIITLGEILMDGMEDGGNYKDAEEVAAMVKELKGN